uniref:Myosin motor domain-containing protein n=1 Tax=Chrysotila carterae TaxID=13221 RepID=A0A7S4BIM4_CHRCT
MRLTRRRGGFRGVVLQFATQLDELLRVVASSQPHFIRCIKPNTFKAAAHFDTDTILRQLRCGGVLEAVRVFASGFPDRMRIGEFVSRFRSAVPVDTISSISSSVEISSADGKASEWERQACVAMLTAFSAKAAEYKLGHSKLFLRAGLLASLNAQRDSALALAVVRCQAGTRGFAARRQSRRELAEARHARLVSEREIARKAEIAELERQQQREREEAEAAAEARRLRAMQEDAALRAKEEARQRQAAERAAQLEAERRERDARFDELQSALESETVAHLKLAESVARLKQELKAAEDESAKLRAEMARERMVTASKDSALRAEVLKWREESGLSKQRERQVAQLAQAKHAQLEAEIGEVRDEASFFRARFQELALANAAESAGRRGRPRSDNLVVNLLDDLGLGGLLGAKPSRPVPALSPAPARLALSSNSSVSASSNRVRTSTKDGRLQLRPKPQTGGSNSPNQQTTNMNFSFLTEPSRSVDEFVSPRLRGGDQKDLLNEYAVYLGLHPQRDASLLWIAEEAAAAPLPSGWSESKDPSGKAYYVHTVTGETTRQHPCDEEFFALVAKSKLDLLHTAKSILPTAGAYNTMQMRSIEQSLSASASEPVRAVVARSFDTSTHSLPIYTFDLEIDEGSSLPCLSAVSSGGLAASFEVSSRLDQSGREYKVQIPSKGKYLMARPGRKGGSEELSAVIFAQPLHGVDTVELVVPHGPTKDGVVQAHTPRGAADGLLARYERGDNTGLLVFIGRIERVRSRGAASPRLLSRLSLPKTASGNLLVRQTNADAVFALEYSEPITPMQAFHVSLALMHWAERAPSHAHG